MLSHNSDLFLQRSQNCEGKKDRIAGKEARIAKGKKNAIVRIASLYYYTHNSDLISRNCKFEFISYNFEKKVRIVR